MASKFNFSSVKSYSATYSARILEDFFRTHEMISGKQILELSSVKQVNLLVIRELFFRWSEEVSNLKSPYFDYSSQEVQEALQEFMNVLSRHISVNKQDFAPILERSVQDTLLLIFAPYEFFSMEVTRANQPEVTHEEVKSWAKYIKVNRYMLDALVNHFEETGTQSISVESALQLFDMVNLEQPEAYKNYLDKFSEVAALSLEQVLENPPASMQRNEPEPPKPSQPHSGYPDTAPDRSGESYRQQERPTNEPYRQDHPTPPPPASDPSGREQGNAGPQNKTDNLFQQPVKPAAAQRIYEQYEAAQKARTLHEEMSQRQKQTSLADRHASQKVSNLSKTISINQRFMFVKELFDGDHQAFEQTLSWLESCSSYSEALNFLTETCANKYNWTMDQEEVIELLELVAKKYD